MKKLEEIQKEIRVGEVMTVDKFLDYVSDDVIGPNDGIGDWLDEDGKYIEEIDFIKFVPKNAVYVNWCNK